MRQINSHREAASYNRERAATRRVTLRRHISRCSTTLLSAKEAQTTNRRQDKLSALQVISNISIQSKRRSRWSWVAMQALSKVKSRRARLTFTLCATLEALLRSRCTSLLQTTTIPMKGNDLIINACKRKSSNTWIINVSSIQIISSVTNRELYNCLGNLGASPGLSPMKKASNIANKQRQNYLASISQHSASRSPPSH